MDKLREHIEIAGFKELLDILDTEKVSKTPVYSGFGLEVYQNNDKQIQIVADFRGDNSKVTINRGY